jgi:hypothetical protein
MRCHAMHGGASVGAAARLGCWAFASLGAPAAVGGETALVALGGRRYPGEAGRDDGRASVNPDLFVMPMISIRKLVVESCRRLVGSSAEARSNVACEHAYQHFMIICSPRGISGRAVRLERRP